MQDTSGAHVWLVLAKAFRALSDHALEPERGRSWRLRFPCARSAAPQGTVAGKHDWSQSMAHPGIDQCRVDRLEKKALVRRKSTDDRRVRLVELTAKGRALIIKTFREHAAAMEEATSGLSQPDRYYGCGG